MVLKKVLPGIVIQYFKESKINYVVVDKNTKVSENFKQFTVACRDLGRFVDLVLQKRSLENSKSLLVNVGIDNGFRHFFSGNCNYSFKNFSIIFFAIYM